MRGIPKFILLAVTLLIFSNEAMSQVRINKRVKQIYELPAPIEPAHIKRWFLPGLAPDKQRIFKSSSTYRLNAANTNSFAGDPYWVGSVTQQSYNGGKVGRFYYWDLQGNLRDSYLFVDIAGKNKRGLKLVFPRSRALF